MDGDENGPVEAPDEPEIYPPLRLFISNEPDPILFTAPKCAVAPFAVFDACIPFDPELFEAEADGVGPVVDAERLCASTRVAVSGCGECEGEANCPPPLSVSIGAADVLL